MLPSKAIWSDSNEPTEEIHSVSGVSSAHIQRFARVCGKFIQFTDLSLSTNDFDADLHIEQNLGVTRTTAACAADPWTALT